MGTTTANMGLSKPTLGGDAGTWDDQNNATIDRVDIHNHTTGLGVQVPSAGIGIDADLTMAGYSLTNLRAAVFTVQTSFATARSLWVRSSDNALVWRSASGTDYKLADNSGLNLSATGGITGDYAAAGAALFYDDTAEAYRFLETAPTPNDWSYIKAGGVDVYEHDASISNFVGLRSPAGLAASYNLSFPAALPGSTSILSVSSAGAITASNTIANAVTLSALLTLSAGATASANQHVTVSGTGRFKHGDRVLTQSGYSGHYAGTTWTNANAGGLESSGVDPCDWCPQLNSGERVKSVTFSALGNGTTDATIAISKIASNGTMTSIGSTSDNNRAAAWGDVTVDLTDTTLGDGDAIVLTVTPNAAGYRVGNIRWTYDHP